VVREGFLNVDPHPATLKPTRAIDFGHPVTFDGSSLNCPIVGSRRLGVSYRSALDSSQQFVINGKRRNFVKASIFIAGLAFAFGLASNVSAQSTAAQQGAPTVKTGSTMKAKAASPAPSPAAKNQAKKTTIGKGKAAAKASGPSSYWTEEVDLHDDGSVETTEFLYDAQRGIVYAYGEDDFTCANGKPEKAAILQAAYATGNKAGKPVGSGYYVVSLNAGQ
jgi:hypothetical protein